MAGKLTPGASCAWAPANIGSRHHSTGDMDDTAGEIECLAAYFQHTGSTNVTNHRRINPMGVAAPHQRGRPDNPGAETGARAAKTRGVPVSTILFGTKAGYRGGGVSALGTPVTGADPHRRIDAPRKDILR